MTDPTTTTSRPLLDVRLPAGHKLRRLIPVGLVLAVLGFGGAIVLGRAAPERFFLSYLVTFVFFWTVAMGGLFFVLLQFATKAGWSVVVRRMAENTMALLPLLAVLFVPLAFGVGHLYEWSHPGAADPNLVHKEAYLNVPFFLARAGIFFAIWLIAANLFWRASRSQDRDGDPRFTYRMQKLAPAFMVLFGLTITYAGFDWLMSLEPHWYSTIYGVYLFAGAAMAICAWLILVAATMQTTGLVRREVNVEHYHDLGKLMFAFMVFWAYIAFSQFMLMWYANMPEETVYFARRYVGGFRIVSLVLLAGHFVVPFFALMSRHIKRRLGLLVTGALWMLAAHYIDIYWLVMPSAGAEAAAPHLIDLALLVGMGGLFVAAFTFMTGKSALVPVGDPRLPESLTFENA